MFSYINTDIIIIIKHYFFIIMVIIVVIVLSKSTHAHVSSGMKHSTVVTLAAHTQTGKHACGKAKRHQFYVDSYATSFQMSAGQSK